MIIHEQIRLRHGPEVNGHLPLEGDRKGIEFLFSQSQQGAMIKSGDVGRWLLCSPEVYLTVGWLSKRSTKMSSSVRNL